MGDFIFSHRAPRRRAQSERTEDMHKRMQIRCAQFGITKRSTAKRVPSLPTIRFGGSDEDDTITEK